MVIPLKIGFSAPTMQKIALAELPDQVFFWRRDDPMRWIKLYGLAISPMGKAPDGQELVQGDPEELILSDPNWCSVCWREFPNWPPIGPCPYCGSESVPRNIEESRRRISEWTGSSSPHI